MTSANQGSGDEKGAAVRLDKIMFSYAEVPFLFDVEFAASKITAIMGASGSGKSSCFPAAYPLHAAGGETKSGRSAMSTVPSKMRYRL